MENTPIIRSLRTIAVIFIFLVAVLQTAAQEMPPKPVTVSFIQNLNFGAFTQATGGGTVIIYPSGLRTADGDIILINYGYSYFPAIFNIEGNPGTIVHVLSGPLATLNGNQGGTLAMNAGTSDPLTPLILPLATQGDLQVYLGGVLTVGPPSSNPAGHYSGSFYIMFIQE